MRVMNISLGYQMRQATGEFTVGAWPKGITVGNWRGRRLCSTIINSFIFIHKRQSVPNTVTRVV